MKSVVKFWLADKGYGFIENPDGSGKDFFVHHSEVHGEPGRKNLAKEEEVEFEVRHGERGKYATNVRKIG